MNNSFRKIGTIFILAMSITVGTLIFIDRYYKYEPAMIIDIPKFNYNNVPLKQLSYSDSAQTSSFPEKNVESEILNLKSKILLPVPFTPQAPTANWDQLHNEACEEAAALMANAYFKDIKDETLEPAYVENEINRLTEWLKTNHGYYLDTASAETAKMMEEVYGLKTKLVANFTADDLKKELTQNRLILISEFGRLLDNPYYKWPGPVHHMLILKGYDEKGFVTNDPGTKRGLNYFYTFDTLYNAAADWDHQRGTVDTNKKIAIVVWK